MFEEEDEGYKVGDLVCRTDLFNKFLLVNKKISKKSFNMLVGTVIATNETVATIRLISDGIVHVSRGTFMKLDSEMAESIQFDE